MAICRELLIRGYKNVSIIDKEKKIASHQSSRNSGVMHAGLYYKPGSLKSKLSRLGIKQMKEFCRKKCINFAECGKIVVAKNDFEIENLNNLYERGIINKLEGIKKINPSEIQSIEPYIKAKAGILVPEESIVNYEEVAKKILEDIRDMGGKVFLNTKIVDLKETLNEKRLISNQKITFKSNVVISSKGLYSDRLQNY